MASTQAQNPNTRRGDEMAEQQKIDTTQYISLLDRFWEILGVILNEDDLENEDKEKMLTCGLGNCDRLRTGSREICDLITDVRRRL